MKTSTWIFIYVIIGLFAISCTQKEKGINNLHVGSTQDAVLYVGQSNEIKADIELDQAIEEIHLEVKSALDDGWFFQEVYAEKVRGQHAVKFSESIDIPIDARTGDYVLTMKVKPQDGAVIEESIQTTFTIDSTVPVASALDVGINAKGNDLHLESELTAVKKIQQVIVKVHGESWSKDFTFDGAKIKDQLSYTFHEHVHVDDAPAGEYQVTLVVQDQEGREAAVEGKFTKK